MICFYQCTTHISLKQDIFSSFHFQSFHTKTGSPPGLPAPLDSLILFSPHLAAHLEALQLVDRLGAPGHVVAEIGLFGLPLLLLPALEQQPVGTGLVAPLSVAGTGLLTRQHNNHHS